MKKFNIGTRLTLGFGAVLALLVALSAIGLWRMHSASAMLNQLIDEKVRNERLINSWQNVVEVNAARTTAAWLAANPAEQQAVEAVMKKSSASATEVQNTLGKVLQQPEAKALLAKVMETRVVYTAARAQVFKEKDAGHLDIATEIFSKDMVGKRERYLDALDKLAVHERKQLDDSGAAINAEYESGRTMLVVLGLLAICLGVLFAYRITRSITVPLQDAVRVARRVATGDLTSDITAEGEDETAQLMSALKDMNNSLVGLVGNVRDGTDMIGTASREIASGNLDLSSRTEAQASSLEETAAAMEELTSAVNFNADHAIEANQLAIDASSVAAKGGAVVADVVATMGSINDSSRKIVDIISVIDGIAFQTNILALNAAVEAARAGEQGRGFAVVAAEVRNLAQRSAGAAKEIKTLIGDSVAKVDTGSRLVEEAGKTMQEVVRSIERVTLIMGDITSASAEQRDGIGQVNLAITQMDDVTQQNTALVEQAAAAAASMQEQAARLSDVVGVFKLDNAVARPQPARPAVSRSTPPAMPRPAARPQAPVAAPRRTALTKPEDEWETF
ncbi:MAG: methyl-accepting chemotaxis protein [Massilia sp.]